MLAAAALQDQLTKAQLNSYFHNIEFQVHSVHLHLLLFFCCTFFITHYTHMMVHIYLARLANLLVGYIFCLH